MVRKDARVGFPRLKFSALVKPRLLPSIIAYQAERKGKSRVVASGGASDVRPPHLKSVHPISRLTPRLLHTSNAVF